MRQILLILSFAVILASCASKPPVQTMAEARAAVQSVRPLFVDQAAQQHPSYRHFQSAEKSLIAATKALDEKKYALAKQKANLAKRQARLAAKIK
ncbi:MAG: DUF4398 domain-containing protein [Mariprofundaceae bacterium]|nr:DUF4398 domain-containing protein [Mariprofundaceae bacterium]